YITEVAERIRQRLANNSEPPADVEEHCRALAYQEMMSLIRDDLQAFGITFESWFSEASLLSSKAVERVLEDLKSRRLLFEQEGAWWFRSSSFGDEKDRVV